MPRRSSRYRQTTLPSPGSRHAEWECHDPINTAASSNKVLSARRTFLGGGEQ